MRSVDLDRAIANSMGAIFRAVWSFRRCFATSALLILVLSVTILLLLTPKYEASSLLIGGQNKVDDTAKDTMSTTEINTSFAHVAESGEVSEKAVRAVGLESLIDVSHLQQQSFFERLRDSILRTKRERNVPLIKLAVPKIMGAVTIQAEPNSNILRFAFRHPDPEVAANFVNALSQAFIEQQIAIFNKEGATTLFQAQKDKYDEEAKQAADKLKEFSARSGIYSEEEQRKLLLTRQSDLFDSIGKIRSTMAEKRGERQALIKQLARLSPGAGSAFADSLLKDLDSDEPPSSHAPPISENRQNGPPLLFSKIYQDSMSALFKVNAELSGAQEQERQELQEESSIVAALKRLAESAARFNELARTVKQAVYNSDLSAKRITEEQIIAESNAAKFSTFRVFQNAEVPIRPVFPNYILGFVLCLIVSLSGALGVTLIAVWRSRGHLEHEGRVGSYR